MPAVRIMTNSGAEITVEASTLQAFQSSVRGMMIRPALQSMLNDTYPAGLYNYYKSHYISGIGAELIDIMVDSFVKVPFPMSALGFEQFGGRDEACWRRGYGVPASRRGI